MSEQKGYKRINFFKGMMTTEKDWNEAEAYHIEKRRLHNHLLHSPGVVQGHAGELRAVARARGDLSVEIQPGYAIDGQGRDLVLFDTAIRAINPDEYRLPQTVFVVLRYYEEFTDFATYKENIEYKGHRRVLESCKVEISQTEPDPNREIELARIYLEKGATRIRDARDPNEPGPNELDLRYVPWAGRAGSALAPAQRLRLLGLISQMRQCGQEYAKRGVMAGHDLMQSASTALMLMATNLIDLSNVFDVAAQLVAAQGDIVWDVDANHPAISSKKEFADYRRHVEILRGLLAERKFGKEGFVNLLAYEGKALETGLQAVAGERAKPKVEAKAQAKSVALADWDPVKVVSSVAATVEVAGQTWTQVDEIIMQNKESESKHNFAIKEATDSYGGRQKLKYPDGTIVEATGRSFVGGYAEFKLTGLVPGKPVVLLRRMDYVYGDYEIDVVVNGKSAGVVHCQGVDRVHRWRNWPAMIAAEHVSDSSVMVRLVTLTAGRDVNIFHLWAYQPK